MVIITHVSQLFSIFEAQNTSTDTGAWMNAYRMWQICQTLWMGIQLCTHRKVSSYTTTLNALLMWYKIFSSINVIVLNIGRSSFDHNNTISVFQYRFSFWTEINRYIGLMAMRYQAYFGSKYRPISSNIGSSFNYVKKKKTNSTG